MGPLSAKLTRRSFLSNSVMKWGGQNWGGTTRTPIHSFCRAIDEGSDHDGCLRL